MGRDGPRPAVVGICSLAHREGAENQGSLADCMAMIDLMAKRAKDLGRSLDMAVLPEHVIPRGLSPAEAAEPLEGPTVSAMATKAREHGTYVAAPVHLSREGRVYNSIVIIDRTGKPVGVYDKAFPVTSLDGSLERGVTPGNSFPTFDLEFGRVGAQICWDIAFPDGWRALADQGAELVVYSTDPVGLVGLRAHAWRHEYYIAASTHRPPAAIVDPTGHVIGTTSSDREVLVACIDLDYRVLNTNCLWDWPESKRREYEGRIELKWRPEEYLYLVTSTDPELPVGRFLEREGLLSGRERRARNLELIEQARRGLAQPPDRAER